MTLSTYAKNAEMYGRRLAHMLDTNGGDVTAARQRLRVALAIRDVAAARGVDVIDLGPMIASLTGAIERREAAEYAAIVAEMAAVPA